MTSYSSRGVFNAAYHDSETLEMDKRSWSNAPHTNPYAREEPVRWGGRLGGGDEAAWGASSGGLQEESHPMDHIPTGAGAPSFPHHPYHNKFQADNLYNQPPQARLPSLLSDNMTVRLRGLAMRRMSMFPHASPADVDVTENAIREEMENDEQNLVKELVGMSTLEQTRAIRELTMSFEEKKNIRNKVMAFRSVKKSHEFTWFAELSENVSLKVQLHYAIGQAGAGTVARHHEGDWRKVWHQRSHLLFVSQVASPVQHFLLRGQLQLHHRPSARLWPQHHFQRELQRTGVTDWSWLLHSHCHVLWCLQQRNPKAWGGVQPTAGLLLHHCCVHGAVWHRPDIQESLSEKAQQKLLTLREKLKHSGIHLGSWLVSTALVAGCAASIFFLCQYEEKLFSQWGPGASSFSLQQEAETLLVPFVVSLMNLVIPLFFSLFNKFEHYSNNRSQIYSQVVRNVLLRMSILGVLCYHWMNEVSQRESFLCWESMVGQALYRLVIVDFLFLMLGSFFGEFLRNVIGTKLHRRLGPPEFDVARNVLDLIYAQTLAWIGLYFSPLLPSIQILKFFILFYLKKVSLTQNCQPPCRTGRAAQMQTIFIFLLFIPFYVGAISIVGYTAWSLNPSQNCGPFRGLDRSFSVVELWMAGLQTLPGSGWAVWIFENIIKSEIFYFLITLIILAITYVFYQLIQGRKMLIDLLKQRIVNEGKDKSFLLDKLQNLQKSRPKKDTKHGRSSHPPSLDGSSGSHSNALHQALLARQQAEQEEARHSDGVSVPADISTSSALMQAMLARQRAERESEDFHRRLEDPPTSLSALSLAMEARQRAEGEMVHDNYREESVSTAVSQAMQARLRAEEEPTVSNAMMQVMQARQQAEQEAGMQWTDVQLQNPAEPGSGAFIQATQARLRAEEEPPASSIMMQVMQARQQAEQEAGMQWAHVQTQNPAGPGSSPLIQAMLARQQAQNEYDDGY
ncbi:transmembrane channel-like protein 5 isoform X2 [Oryzias latipes]|uniref:transmembrane channel-like protein 5 isoform X2 n=1 Tax=Oryzias latipes TaxID=8090 RepID=UPI0009DA317F|nr:transmembrane channel-like protein 5 isoform X2 [Oryzias latipes]